MRVIRILVTGSRDWTDQRRLMHRLMEEDPCAEHGDCNTDCPRLVVIHGGCPTGADAMADEFARQSGWTVEVHPARWDRYGKSAGMIRNSEMVRLGADVCLAFVKNNSPGASHTARLAEKAGIPVRRFDATD